MSWRGREGRSVSERESVCVCACVSELVYVCERESQALARTFIIIT